MIKPDAFILDSLSHMQPKLYWLDSDAQELAPLPMLASEITAELCIVGAGFTGLWMALIAKEENPEREVVILEQKETGAGASGRNGGFCSSSLTHGFSNGYSRFRNEMATIENFARENLSAIESTIRKYGIACNFERTGELRVATELWQLLKLQEEADLRNSLGDHVEVLTKEELALRIKSPLYEGALWDPEGNAMIDPARLVWGLEEACLSLGVKIYEHSKVEKLEDAGNSIIVHTPDGRVLAAKVALATNVFPSLIRSARKYVVPVYDFQLMTQPLSSEQRESIGWYGREGVSEAGNKFHYYRLSEAGEILWGGYDAIYHFGGKVRPEYENDSEAYRRLAADFFKTFPQLAGIKFTYGWGGAIDTCSRFSSFWGKAFAGRVVYVLGFTGLGVAATRFGAQVALDLLAGKDNERTRLSMVRKKPFPFPPEPLRFIFIRLTQWSIDRADLQQGRRNLWLKLLDTLGLGFDS